MTNPYAGARDSARVKVDRTAILPVSLQDDQHVNVCVCVNETVRKRMKYLYIRES